MNQLTDNNPAISIIVAMGRQNQIGLNGTMPWHLSGDLKNFKKLTSGHPVIMGRKTFESIGKALPKRLNLVVTSNPANIHSYNVCPVSGLEQAVKQASLAGKEIFIIGGATIYKQSLDIANKLIITHVDYNGDADTYMPEIDWKKWKIVDKQSFKKDERNDYNFEIVTYLRNPAGPIKKNNNGILQY